MEIDEKIREALAPSIGTREKFKAAIAQYSIYMIIVLVTSLVVFVPPLVNGCLYGDVGLFFPKNAEGWVLWGITNGGASLGNVSLLILFKIQAKRNVAQNENYKKANELMEKLAKEKSVFVPRSPKKMDAEDYSSKIICIVISTMSSFMVLSSLIINFDVVTLISTVLSAVITLCFSWVTMIRNEEYWTGEYLLYAEMMQKKLSKEDQI